MVIAIAVIHLLIIFLVARRIRRGEDLLARFFWPALLFKLLAGIALGLIYTFYYETGDTFGYIKDASSLATLALHDFQAYADFLFFNNLLDSVHLTLYEPRAVFLTKITSVFCLVTISNYWVISLYFSFISFLGAWFLVKTIHHHIPLLKIPAVIAFLFLPSVVYWTSGVIKESLAVAALYYLAAAFLKVWFNERIRFVPIVVAVISLWILWQLKYYYMAIFLPVVCTTLLYKFIFRARLPRSVWLKIIAWMILLTVPLFLISFLHPNFYPERFLDVILFNNAAYTQLSAPEDLIHFTDLQAKFWSIARNAPWALFSGLFRPLFWEAGNLLQFLAAIENTLLLFFFLAALSQVKKFFNSPYRIPGLAILVYVALLCIFITLSAPNFGTLSRYRAGYFSFFVFLILCHNPFLYYLERSFHRLVSQ